MPTGYVEKISAVVVPKGSDILAGQIREMIISGQYEPGNFLPPERKLVEQSGLSRTTVRDALRILEAEGLLTTKVGRNGGSVVSLPNRSAAARSVELFVRTHKIDLDTLLDCRIAIEPMLAQLAARNRTESELAEMRKIHVRFEKSLHDVEAYKIANLDWHLSVAQAANNDPLLAFMEAIADPIKESMEHRHTTTKKLRETAIAIHTSIMEAIETQDEQAAFRRMQRHVTIYKDIATSSS